MSGRGSPSDRAFVVDATREPCRILRVQEPHSSDLAVYQAAVRRLTAQVAATQRQLDTERAAHRAEVAALQAQLREGLTPELVELRRSLSQWRSRAQAAEQRLRETRRTKVSR